MGDRWGSDGASASGGLSGSAGKPASGSAPAIGGVSGRMFVVVACLVILSLWGGIYLAFSGWKSRYEALAEYGRAEVAPLVDGLAPLVPEGVDSKRWQEAVSDTHTMLIGLTSSGLLDQVAMNSLRDDIKMRVDRATPETSLSTLSALWNDLEERAGPVISSVVAPVNPNSRHAKRIPRPPRPPVLPPNPVDQEKQTRSFQ